MEITRISTYNTEIELKKRGSIYDLQTHAKQE